MKKLMLTAALCAAVGMVYAWPGAVKTRKILAEGWDLAGSSPEEVLEHADLFAKCGVDGVVVPLWGFTNHGVYKSALNDPQWRTEEVMPRVAALKKLSQTPGLKESLLAFVLSPVKRISWADDASWKRAADQIRGLAKIAKAGGIRGFQIDPEDYTLSRQYFHNPKMDGCDYDTAWKLARRRGAEFFGAMFAEHPDAVLLAFWLFTLDETYAATDDAKAAAKAKGDLWPAFLNGLLDVVPPRVRLLDGNEHTYWSESHRRDYYLKSRFPVQDVLALVEPENRAKYKAQVEMSCAYYLDHYTKMNTTKKNPDDPTAGLTPVEHFNRNLHQGLRVAAEYVWVNGERFCWVPWKKSPKSYLWKLKHFAEKLEHPETCTWESQLPGLADMFNSVRNPEAYYRSLPVGKAVELVTNGACKADAKGGISAPYTPFMDKKRCPEVSVCVDTTDGDGDKSCFAVRKTDNMGGCVILDVPVVSCGIYRVAFSAKGPETGVSGRICWKHGAHYDWTLPQTMMAFSKPNAAGWMKGEAFVCVPEGVDMLSLQASAGSQPVAEADIKLDNFSVLKIR